MLLQNRSLVWQSTGRAADILAKAYARSEKVDDPWSDERYVFYTVLLIKPLSFTVKYYIT